jgi:hypothetical protein
LICRYPSRMGGDLQEHRRLSLRRRSAQARPYRPGPFAAIYGALLIAGSSGAVGLYFLLLRIMHGSSATLSTKLDVARTALLVVGGSGALAGLYVAYRKQRTDEATHIRDQDKLFTERYTQAVAQLGNPAAAVRLGGVYALARIADDSERDRPTCLNLLCAYLRMPPESDALDKSDEQVRVAAQNVLANRLRPSNQQIFWADSEIDLRGATLTELDFADCAMANAKFDGAKFIGVASFERVRLNDALFDRTDFSDGARFDKATINGYATFRGASFGVLQSSAKLRYPNLPTLPGQRSRRPPYLIR